MDGPHATAVDSNDNVFVTGNDSDNVFKVTPGGVVSVILDATGDGQGNPLDNPTGIATDPAGNVYVNGYFSSNVFRVTPAGGVTEIMDSTGDGIHSFIRPADMGICVDVGGNCLYGGDQFRHRIQNSDVAHGDAHRDTPTAGPTATPTATPAATPTAGPPTSDTDRVHPRPGARRRRPPQLRPSRRARPPRRRPPHPRPRPPRLHRQPRASVMTSTVRMGIWVRIGR